jgi:hypothetical protein
MRKILIISSLVLTMTGCFVSRTEERVRDEGTTTSGVGRRCGNEICAPDQRCVESDRGFFHCD